MVIAWYILSSDDWRAGVKRLESAGSEAHAEWEEGCIVGLPFSAFRQCYEIDCGPVPFVPESLDVHDWLRISIKRWTSKQNSRPYQVIGKWRQGIASITRTGEPRLFLS